MSKKLLTPLFLFVLVTIFYFVSNKFYPAKNPTQGNSAVLGQRIKTTTCQEGVLPDKDCTPGNIDPTLTVTVICNPNWSTSQVRNVGVSEKRQAYEEYGLTYPQGKGAYEADHLIPLELGGANDISNMWPEAANPVPGFHEKDIVENYLHERVCHGEESLGQAQQDIATNWLVVYQHIPNPQQFNWHGAKN